MYVFWKTQYQQKIRTMNVAFNELNQINIYTCVCSLCISFSKIVYVSSSSLLFSMIFLAEKETKRNGGNVERCFGFSKQKIIENSQTNNNSAMSESVGVVVIALEFME